MTALSRDDEQSKTELFALAKGEGDPVKVKVFQLLDGCFCDDGSGGECVACVRLREVWELLP